MKAKVARWGNSLAVRIPKHVAETFRIVEGTDLELTEHREELRMKPIRAHDFDLSTLLNGITPGNLHGECSSGSPKGKEVW